MLKRLIMGVLALSVVVMVWPAASVQAACSWQPLAGGQCYFCPGTPYYVSGVMITPKTKPTVTSDCVYWYPKCAIMNAVAKLLPTDAKDCDGDACPLAVAAVIGDLYCPDPKESCLPCWDESGTGKFDWQGRELRVLDQQIDWALAQQCSTQMNVLCCPPGHTDPLTGLCTDPIVISSGWPGYNPGISGGAEAFTTMPKRVSRTEVEISFEDEATCPNTNWGRDVSPAVGYMVTCTAPLGFEYVTDSGLWKACYQRDDMGVCVRFAPPEGYKSIDETAVVMRCLWPPDPSDPQKGCNGALPGDDTGVGNGFCNELYSYIKNNNP